MLDVADACLASDRGPAGRERGRVAIKDPLLDRMQEFEGAAVLAI
jgi:hypothetical protein